ncbi:MAG TPA: hypothetical protein VFC76_08095, partial [Oscillospiraceae bacterium]|nr:hypothetical protein [Oscillospiraceae bacterium]
LKKAKASTIVQEGDPSNTTKTTEEDNAGPVDNTIASDNTEDTTAAGNDSTTSGGGTTAQQKQGMSKAEILNIYKNAVNKVKNNAAAGYTKKEWQSLPELDIGTLGKILNPFIDRFMTQEADAKEEINAKGSDEAKRRFPACTLTDLSKIATATCTESGGNYNIKIVMIDEKNPKESNNFLGQITNSVLYEESIREEVDGLVLFGSPLVDKGYTFDITYNAFTITAKITKDGKFISLEHFANVPIKADAKVAKIYNLNGTARLENNCKYYDFKY